MIVESARHGMLGPVRTCQIQLSDSTDRVYEYNGAGQLVSVRFIAETAGADRLLETYEYDSNGCRKKTLFVDRAANLLMFWTVEGSDTGYSAPGTVKAVTLYNDRDQPSELLLLDVAGRQVNRVEFRYDEAGRLIEEIELCTAETHQL